MEGEGRRLRPREPKSRPSSKRNSKQQKSSERSRSGCKQRDKSSVQQVGSPDCNGSKQKQEGLCVTVEADDNSVTIRIPKQQLSTVVINIDCLEFSRLLVLTAPAFASGIRQSYQLDNDCSLTLSPSGDASLSAPIDDISQQQAILSINLPDEDDKHLLLYYPVSARWMAACCQLFGIPLHKPREWHKPAVINRESVPVRKQISGDNNCCFRAISFAICGEQMYHLEVRAKLVAFMKTYSIYLPSILDDEYESVEEYIAASNMEKPQVWGGAVELQALATLTQTPVHVYIPQGWLRAYQPLQLPVCSADFTMDRSNVINGERIYLSLIANHYEGVLRVKSDY